MTQPAPPDGSGGHALVTLDGRYHIVERIAAGGMGEVFRATDAVLAREVAIKVLLDGAFSSGAAKRRFEREIDLVASLKHPNIVSIFDRGVADGSYGLTVNLSNGATPLGTSTLVIAHDCHKRNIAR